MGKYRSVSSCGHPMLWSEKPLGHCGHERRTLRRAEEVRALNAGEVSSTQAVVVVSGFDGFGI